MTAFMVQTPPGLAGLERRVQVTWIAPVPEGYDDPELDVQPPPRSNLVASVSRAGDVDAAAAAATFWQQTSQAVPGIDRMEEGAVVFDDGTPGFRMVVEFAATAEVRLRQTHLFRVDGDMLTQYVATVDEATRSLEGELEAAARATGVLVGVSGEG